MWELIICAAITWAGCGDVSTSKYPNEESCYRALKNILVVDQPIAESKNKRSMYAYCHPVEVKEKK